MKKSNKELKTRNLVEAFVKKNKGRVKIKIVK